MKKQIQQLLGNRRNLSLALSLGAFLALGAMQAQAIHIGNFVWYDANGNGIQDAGEPGINGVVVELYKCGTSELLFTTVTADGPDGVAGYYQFGYPVSTLELNVGYYVKFHAPTGYKFTTQYAGTDIALDSNANPTSGESDCITFVEPIEDQTFDAGLVLASTVGTGTPGYWANHPDAWPVDSIVIGGVTYTKAQAISLIQQPVKKDKWLTMFPALVCAELNVLIGAESSCITTTISQADAWMTGIKRPVPASSQLWQVGGPLYEQLDAYNNGLLCAPHRD
jgi:hypothetical protein